MSEIMKLSNIREDDIYTPKQIGDILRVPAKRIAAAFRKGELAGIELGPKTIRITGKAVREWLTTKNPSMSSVDSGGRAKNSQTGNGASTSNGKAKSVADLVLASL
jgi:hypothetical protein